MKTIKSLSIPELSTDTKRKGLNPQIKGQEVSKVFHLYPVYHKYFVMDYRSKHVDLSVIYLYMLKVF